MHPVAINSEIGTVIGDCIRRKEFGGDTVRYGRRTVVVGVGDRRRSVGQRPSASASKSNQQLRPIPSVHLTTYCRMHEYDYVARLKREGRRGPVVNTHCERSP